MPDPRRFPCPPPPDNSSATTRQELREVRRLTKRRSEDDIEEILTWSVEEPSPMTNWVELADELCAKYGLNPPRAGRVQYYLAAAIHCALVACWHHKYAYLRPRPTDLDPSIDTSVIPVPQHPAYPSGHSTVAGAAAAVLKAFFPNDAEEIEELAEESGISRLKAGIHFRSDHTAGLELGQSVAAGVLTAAAKDSGPGPTAAPAPDS